MKIANIVAFARPGRARVRARASEGHCGCARLCAGQKDLRSGDHLPPTCAVRRLLDADALCSTAADQ
jgi:hypothetical protein